MDGTPTTLYAAAGGGTSVLVFYRGAWCPYCNIALSAYQAQLLPQLTERGIPLVAVSPQKPDGSLSMQQKNDLDFAVVSDPGNAIAGCLGILTGPSEEARAAQLQLGLDLAGVNADGTVTLPMPATVILDASHAVRWIDVHPDYSWFLGAVVGHDLVVMPLSSAGPGGLDQNGVSRPEPCAGLDRHELAVAHDEADPRLDGAALRCRCPPWPSSTPATLCGGSTCTPTTAPAPSQRRSSTPSDSSAPAASAKGRNGAVLADRSSGRRPRAVRRRWRASRRTCHRCHRSATWTAPGVPAAAPSA